MIQKRNDICKLGGYKNEITKENERLSMGCFYESKEFGIYRKK